MADATCENQIEKFTHDICLNATRTISSLGYVLVPNLSDNQLACDKKFSCFVLMIFQELNLKLPFFSFYLIMLHCFSVEK